MESTSIYLLLAVFGCLGVFIEQLGLGGLWAWMGISGGTEHFIPKLGQAFFSSACCSKVAYTTPEDSVWEQLGTSKALPRHFVFQFGPVGFVPLNDATINENQVTRAEPLIKSIWRKAIARLSRTIAVLDIAANGPFCRRPKTSVCLVGPLVILSL